MVPRILVATRPSCTVHRSATKCLVLDDFAYVYQASHDPAQWILRSDIAYVDVDVRSSSALVEGELDVAQGDAGVLEAEGVVFPVHPRAGPSEVRGFARIRRCCSFRQLFSLSLQL